MIDTRSTRDPQFKSLKTQVLINSTANKILFFRHDLAHSCQILSLGSWFRSQIASQCRKIGSWIGVDVLIFPMTKGNYKMFWPSSEEEKERIQKNPRSQGCVLGFHFTFFTLQNLSTFLEWWKVKIWSSIWLIYILWCDR